MYKRGIIEIIYRLIMAVSLVLVFTGLAEASTGSIIDTFIDESMIASKYQLDITGGEIYLGDTSNIYESYTAGGSSSYENMYSIYWGAQTFTTATAHKVNSVKLQLKRGGSGSDRIVYVYIRTTSGGYPTTTTLSSGSIDRMSIPTSATWMTIPVSEAILSAGTMYSIVASCSGSSAQSALWYGLATGAYEGGTWFRSTSSGSSWTQYSAKDHRFEVWGDAYYSSGNFVSTNLLSSLDVSSIDSFDYNASSIPADAGMQIQFSLDNVNWYNSSGVLNGWDSLSEGENSIDLSSLGWSGESFYYKTEFNTGVSYATSVLDEIGLNYTEAIIPEPSSLLLLGIGVFGVTIFKYKFNKKS